MDAQVVAEAAERLAKSVVALGDNKIRVVYLQAIVSDSPPVDVAQLWSRSAQLTMLRNSEHALLHLLLSVALAAPEIVDARKQIVLEATKLRHTWTAAALQTVDLLDGHLAAPVYGDRTFTLGERKSLARRRDRALMDRVIGDPNPAVIEIFLNNPALRESDVVKLCARRPVAKAVIVAVFRNPRWITRGGVRTAIVRNPYSPSDLALQLAPHLSAAEAREVARSPELPIGVRKAGRRVVRTIRGR